MTKSAILPRKASRAFRREQLIEATISTIARCGYAQTTLSEVALTAGVSHGLVNFHFQSKEKLLQETLLSLSDEYCAHWFRALEQAGPDPATQLDALIAVDFSDAVCEPDRLVAWCAFWGETQSRPLYQELCAGNDVEYRRVLESICAKISEEGDYGIPADRAARVLRVTIEGVWLDMMFSIAPYSKQEAMETVYFCAATFFPRHFTSRGLIRR